MQLDEFVEALQFDPEKVRFAGDTVDWEDAPLSFKLYQNTPATLLPLDIAVNPRAGNLSRTAAATLKEVATLLWYSYGLTQVCHAALPLARNEKGPEWTRLLRRYVPSGGGLYPSELYAYLKVDKLSAGIYHYDAAHHRLMLLREGNFDDYLERALGRRCDLSGSVGALIVSTVFWKNFFKYHNFAYRLGALDAGAVVGQVLLAAQAFGYGASAHFQFLDGAVNRVLGLQDDEESVYAVMPLHAANGGSATAAGEIRSTGGVDSAQTLCSKVCELHPKDYRKSKHLRAYPMLLEMNRASMYESTDQFRPLTEPDDSTPDTDGQVVSLPSPRPSPRPSEAGFAAACRGRFSPGFDFVPGSVDLDELSTLLSETMTFGYVDDLAVRTERAPSRLQIACCVHGIDGLADGAYLYDSPLHALRLVEEGDFRAQLAQGMSMPTVNLFQVPITVHIAGDRDFYRDAFGRRGYRLEQMEAGICLQSLLLTASALGMSGHPLLDYDARLCDSVYRWAANGRTCLIQVPIGRFCKSSRFDSPLFR